MLNTVAIIGRPNVGKSTLFNKLTKSRSAIVSNFSGLTKDRNYGLLSHGESNIFLIDTGGIDDGREGLENEISEQAWVAVDESSLVLFVIDGSEELTNLDQGILENLRKRDKKFIPILNKNDKKNVSNAVYDLSQKGIKESLSISAEHSIGLDNLKKYLKSNIPENVSDSNESNSPKISIIGRPNAGKSTLFNALLNKERSTVSNIPGTTRDKVVESLEANKRKYLITDTAGIPRKKQKDQIDRYSSEISIKSLENADIALIVVDSEIGLSFEDKRILNSSIENFVTPLLILNKWDLLDTEQKKDINNSINRDLKQYRWVNVIRVSALNTKNIIQIAKNIDSIEEQLNLRISTSELNSYFRELWVKSPPHPFRGKRAKLKFVSQFSTKPPEFGFSLSSRVPKNYVSFIENNIRKNFNMGEIAFRIKINA